MTARRYAEGTTVTVEASRGEITGILAKHGVQRMGWFSEPEADTLNFELDGFRYQFHIMRPTHDDVKTQYRASGGNVYRITDWQAKVDAEWRRRWRAHVLLLKAKLEFAASGDSTVQRELMPYILLKDGRTLEEVIGSGGMPLLTATAGDR